MFKEPFKTPLSQEQMRYSSMLISHTYIPVSELTCGSWKCSCDCCKIRVEAQPLSRDLNLTNKIGQISFILTALFSFQDFWRSWDRTPVLQVSKLDEMHLHKLFSKDKLGVLCLLFRRNNCESLGYLISKKSLILVSEVIIPLTKYVGCLQTCFLKPLLFCVMVYRGTISDADHIFFMQKKWELLKGL